MYSQRVLIFAISLFVLCDALFVSARPYRGAPRGRVVLKRALDGIRKSQWRRNSKYFPSATYPPLTWNKQRGLYPSAVHLNFHGEVPAAQGRNLYQFPDDNGFVTMFVLHGLSEILDAVAGSDNRALRSLVEDAVREDDLVHGIEAVAAHKDLNPQYANASALNFWNMRPNTTGGDKFASYPANIAVPLGSAKNGFEVISKGLHAVKLGQLSDQLKRVSGLVLQFMSVFHIPADADDSGCNLALGGQLLSLQSRGLLPRAADTWKQLNSDGGAIFDIIKKYAYRPFSDDQDAAMIDPRTYFWLHPFLVREKERGDTDSVLLVTTWLQHHSEIKESAAHGSSKMPFSVNNIDATVLCNALYGMASMVIHGGPEYADKLDNDRDLQNLFKSSIRLLAWILETDQLSKRADLVLLYYPPVYDFYWFGTLH